MAPAISRASQKIRPPQTAGISFFARSVVHPTRNNTSQNLSPVSAAPSHSTACGTSFRYETSRRSRRAYSHGFASQRPFRRTTPRGSCRSGRRNLRIEASKAENCRDRARTSGGTATRPCRQPRLRSRSTRGALQDVEAGTRGANRTWTDTTVAPIDGEDWTPLVDSFRKLAPHAMGAML